jgi:uncharacterized protein (TIGR02246 family)
METTKRSSNLDAIEQIRNRHVAALNAGDAGAWASEFAADAVQMPPHLPANVGIQAIQGWSRGFLSMFRCQFALEVDEVRAEGDWAIERGRYTIKLTPSGGGPTMDDVGKYITIYERKDGSAWKITNDIWNSDLPMPQ